MRSVALLAVSYGLYYITWRWLNTLNPDALWFAIPLALAETLVVVRMALSTFETWKLEERSPPAPPRDLAVDVFITTYNEPIEVVRKTALAARQIRYPHRTYLLDDGRSPAVRALAEELGIGYLTRPDNRHAKAGNLNNALQQTDGEFILQLDADHVPLPHILERTLGFFEDPAVALVQTPQDFYNTGSFMHSMSKRARRIWDEQRFFFSVVLPGRDHWNAAFFCGSCGVVRRAALEQIGGFQGETITEDMETTLVLHSQGWKTIYHAESMAYGLAPDTAAAYHVQRLRWGQGTMQIFRKYNPLTYPGLSLPQRICYLSSVLHYFEGLQYLVLYTAPILFLLTGILPIRSLDNEFLIRFVPYLVLSLLAFELVARGRGVLWITERYNMARFVTYVRSLGGLFAKGRLRFNVTPKRPGHVPFRVYAPQAVLMVATIAAVVWGIFGRHGGWLEHGPGLTSLAFWMSLAWATWNFGMAGVVVRMSLPTPHRRTDHRFADAIPAEFRVLGLTEGEARLGLVQDVSTGGVSLRSTGQLPPSGYLRLRLPLAAGVITVVGEIVHRSEAAVDGVKVSLAGVRFLEIAPPVRDAIELHCLHHSVPTTHMRFNQPADVIERIVRWIAEPRREGRRAIHLPARVTVARPGRLASIESVGVVSDMSRRGVGVIMEEPVGLNERITVEISGSDRRREGRVVSCRSLATPVGVRFLVGVDTSAKAARRAPAPTAQRRRKMQANGSRVGGMLAAAGKGMSGMVAAVDRWMTAAALIATLGTLAVAARAEAQEATLFTGSEWTGDEVALYQVGVSVSLRRHGLGPTASVQGSYLSYPIGAEDEATIYSVTPAVGLRYRGEDGFVVAKGGYSFKKDGADVPLYEGGRSGATASGHVEYWGSYPVQFQALGSYNFASEFLWSRARATYRLLNRVSGGVNVGAEVAWMGEFDESVDPYRATLYGPLLQWSGNHGLITGIGAGWKNDNAAAESTWYFKLELVYSL